MAMVVLGDGESVLAGGSTDDPVFWCATAVFDFWMFLE